MHTDRHLGLDREKRGQITVINRQQGYIALLPFCLRIMSLCVSIIHVQYTYIFNTLFFHKFFLFLRSSGMMPRYFFFLCVSIPYPPIYRPGCIVSNCAGVSGATLAGQCWRGSVGGVGCVLREKKINKNKKILQDIL